MNRFRKIKREKHLKLKIVKQSFEEKQYETITPRSKKDEMADYIIILTLCSTSYEMKN